MSKLTLTRDGQIFHVGQHVGYIENYRLYMNGRLIGEYSTYPELIRMINEELSK